MPDEHPRGIALGSETPFLDTSTAESLWWPSKEGSCSMEVGQVAIPRKRLVAIILLASFVVAGSSIAALAARDIILTNKGEIAEGTVTGIAAVIRLTAPDEVTMIGPDAQFDIARSSILQITLDFPRVVIEAEGGVLIGPFSAFAGIGEELRLERSGASTIAVPTASLRAIALNGHALRPVPREWMGDRFLSEPEILAASPLVAEQCADCAIVTPTRSTVTVDTTTDDGETPLWDFTPVEPPEEEAGLPWWIGLVGVAALVLIATLLTSGGSSS